MRETTARQLGVPLEQVQLDARLAYDLGADSPAITELCLALE